MRALKMEINSLLKKIIEEKYEELKLGEQETGPLYKIKFFEGNAIGQIGESFIRQLFLQNGLPLDDDRNVVHDEYDILSSGEKIEIKTARLGNKNKTFQFNGINPSYNHDYIILLGLTVDRAYYRIINGHSTYNHKKRKYFISVGDKEKQLVAMNPGNAVNYKLTLTLADLLSIDSLNQDLISLFRK